MDVWALGDGRFSVGAFRQFKSKWNKDGTLALWGGAAHVMTNPGVFVEVVDRRGAVVDSGGDGQWFYVNPGKARVALRYKKLPDPKLTKAALQAARQKVTRTLVCDSPYSLDMPETLPGAIVWLERKLAEIPEAARAGARCRFDTSTRYGDTYPEFSITYTEPETDDEVRRRVMIERERAARKEAAERQQLAHLKRKFKAAA